MINNRKNYSETFFERQPKDWGTQKLSDIIESLDAGVSVNSEDRPANEDEIGILKTSSVKGGKLFPNENKVVIPDEIKRVKINPIKDSIIISRMNTPELVGEIAYVNKDYKNLFLPDRLWQTSYKKNVSGKWLAYLLNLSNFRFKVKNIATGTSNSMKNISKKGFLSLRIPLLEYDEQRKIASILSICDKAIELKEKLIEQKKVQKKGLMQKLLTGEVRLPVFEGEWKEYKLGKLGITYNGLSGKSAKDFGDGKPYIPYKTIFDNSKIKIESIDYVNITENEKQNSVKYGDVFFTTSSETPNEVAMSSVLLDEVGEMYLNSFCFGYRLNNFINLLPEYARYLFRTNGFRRNISKLAQGSTRYNISKNEIMKVNVLIPSIEEQRAIAQILDCMGKEIEYLNKQVENYKKQKKGLMQLLLTGKVRVKV